MTPPMRFKHQDQTYKQAIDYLMDHPQEVYEAWGNPTEARGGSLFLYCSPSGSLEGTNRCGCVSQVHRSQDKPWSLEVVGFSNSKDIAKRIKADERIPAPHDWDVYREDDDGPWSPPTRETLELFAAYQTEMDEMAIAMKEEKS